MFLCASFPSSSIIELPHSFSIVPSSISVTLSEAIFLPKSSENTDTFGATDVASKPCPQASWKITAPKPGAITTGSSPPLKSIASNFSTAVLAASVIFSSTLNSSSIS